MRILSFLVLLMLISACKDDTLGTFDVVYEVEFQGDWSASSHPTDFPSNAHFSPIVAVSHAAGIEVFTEGLEASEGVVEVAETGATGIIEDELQVLINTSLALDQNKGESFDSPGSNKVLIGVGLGYSTVTVLSMIAPSPDWFVAGTTNLIDPADGLWFDEVTVDLLTYDCGSDSGLSFTDADNPTDPKEGVAQITSGPLVEGGTSVVNMGQFVFKRVQ